MLGDCRVGKTSFFNIVTSPDINNKKTIPTIGVEYKNINIKVYGESVNVNVFDTCNKSFTQLEHRNIDH